MIGPAAIKVRHCIPLMTLLGCGGGPKAVAGGSSIVTADAMPSVAEHDQLEVTSLAAGGDGTCALLSDGGVVCWGDLEVPHGFRGSQIADLLGNGEPERVHGLPPVVEVAVGEAHRCARTRAGQVWCWGSNDAMQLGRNTKRAFDPQPQRIPTVDRATRVVVGGALTCVQLSAGVTCWGGEFGRRLRDKRGGTAPTFDLPVRSPKNLDIWQDDAACVQEQSDGWRCWTMVVWSMAVGGAKLEKVTVPNRTTHLLDGDRDPEDSVCTEEDAVTDCNLTEVADAAEIVGSAEHTCARDGQGEVHCWGIEARISEDAVRTRDSSDADGQVTLKLPRSRLIAGGDEHACSLSLDGAVHCWGNTDSGQLGSGRGGYEEQPQRLPVTGVQRLGLNDFTTCMQTSTGTHCTGSTEQRGCGLGTVRTADARALDAFEDGCILEGEKAKCHRRDPTHTQVLPFPPLATLAARSWPARACGTTKSGDVVCRNDGTNHTLAPLSPAQDVAFDSSRICAVTVEGKVMCTRWPGGTHPFPAPQQLFADGDFVHVRIGGGTICAITQTGKVQCLGHSLFAPPTSQDDNPRDILLPAAAKQLIIGRYHACAILADQTAHCWGDNRYGNLGSGPTRCSGRPVNITNTILQAAQESAPQ